MIVCVNKIQIHITSPETTTTFTDSMVSSDFYVDGSYQVPMISQILKYSMHALNPMNIERHLMGLTLDSNIFMCRQLKY
jgi:hypothetical protein